jgi:inositol-hexakisphosphate/diphosphoinositol-pentakisphosphate 1-kinase
MQASDDAKSFVYFTKESHIYTLLNCILEGGITTKIKRSAIPELDYLSQICFELYESENKTPPDAQDVAKYAYSIRITISPGCHTFDPLDVQLDSKHCISCAPRRSLTAHADWKEVIETLRAKFHTVKLPKSFLAVNLSESHTFHKKDEHERDMAATQAGYVPAEGVGSLDHLPVAEAAVEHDHRLGPELETRHDDNSSIPPTPDSRSS